MYDNVLIHKKHNIRQLYKYIYIMNTNMYNNQIHIDMQGYFVIKHLIEARYPI